MFSTSVSSWSCVRFDVPLKAMCSRKCATPLFSSVSYREPVSIHTPTVAVSPPDASDAIRSWLRSRGPGSGAAPAPPRSRGAREERRDARRVPRAAREEAAAARANIGCGSHDFCRAHRHELRATMAESRDSRGRAGGRRHADDAAPAKPAATHVLAQAVLDFEEGDAQVRFGQAVVRAGSCRSSTRSLWRCRRGAGGRRARPLGGAAGDPLREPRQGGERALLAQPPLRRGPAPSGSSSSCSTCCSATRSRTCARGAARSSGGGSSTSSGRGRRSPTSSW